MHRMERQIRMKRDWWTLINGTFGRVLGRDEGQCHTHEIWKSDLKERIRYDRVKFKYDK